MLPRAIIMVGALFAIFGRTVVAQESVPARTPHPYSESIPYKPRLFQVGSEKRSKDKNAKDATPAPSQTPNPEQMPGSGPTVVEDSPITIPVSVFNLEGKFLSGLAKEDFKVFVDGPEARVLSVEQRAEPLNVLLVVDTSPSGSEVLESVKKLATKLIGEFSVTDKISVMEFNGQLKELAPLSVDRDASIKAVSKLKMGDGTSLYDISRKIFGEMVPSLSGRTVVIVVTDGVDTTSRGTRYSEALAAAEMSGATVYPIYLDTLQYAQKGKVSMNGVPVFLQQAVQDALARQRPQASSERLADDYTIGKVFLNDLVYLSGGRASDANSLLQNRTPIAATIAEELHQQYYVTFAPVGSAFIGQRKHLKVRLERPGLVLLARGSYIVGSPPSKVSAR